jgi:hypothetical protein
MEQSLDLNTAARVMALIIFHFDLMARAAEGPRERCPMDPTE